MGEKRGHYCVDGEMWDIDEDGYPTLVSGPSAVNVCKAFLELFRDSDMRPEDECHVLYDAAERSIAGAESDNANLRSKLTAAESERDGYKARCDALEKAIARYLAEKSQPGSDRRAEYAALKSLHQLAATEVK